MMSGKRREYVVPDMHHENGTIETFKVVELDATLEDLFRRGQGNAAGQREAYRDRARSRGEQWAWKEEEENSEPWAFEPDRETKHQWAWNYIRHNLTNYDELVKQFGFKRREYPFCESCKLLHAADEPYGLAIDCHDCEGLAEAIDVEYDGWVMAIRLGIARWAKQRWPGLEIDEEGLWGKDLTIPPEPYEPEDADG